MICQKILTNADLSDTSLKAARGHLYGDSHQVLYVGADNLSVAMLLLNSEGIEVRLDTNLPENAWYVTNKYFGIYSPGA